MELGSESSVIALLQRVIKSAGQSAFFCWRYWREMYSSPRGKPGVTCSDTFAERVCLASPFDARAVAKLAEYRLHYCASLIRAIAYSATVNHNEIGVACLVAKLSHASSSSATATSAGKGRSARSEGENKLLDYQFTTVLHFFGVQTRQYSCS